MDLSQLKRSKAVHLCFAITFFTSGLIVNLLQCILYIFLRPINKRVYRKINWYLCATLYAQLVFMGDWWSNSKVLLYINKDDFYKYWGKEHAYCIMNHTYEVDWLIGWMLCERISLLGNCKAYAKKVIQYLPILGWCWKFSEFVFLERSFDKDKDIINRQITELADHPDPMWLLLFPEGTRFTETKHKASVEFAEKKGIKPLKYHLIPRTKGFIASLPSMKGKVPAIYDIQLAFKEDSPTKPTMTNLLLGKSITAHMYMKRIPFDEIPTTEEGQDMFLRELFEQKDKLKDSFIKTGDFFETSGVPKLEPFVVNRRITTLLNQIFWLISILIPMACLMVKLLLTGQFIYLSILVGIIVAFAILLNKTIGMSKISKGSSYGAKIEQKQK